MWSLLPQARLETLAFPRPEKPLASQVVTAPGPMRWVITFPSGKKDGAPGGGSLELPLDETGSYLLTVTESPMGEAWRGKFKIVIHIDK